MVREHTRQTAIRIIEQSHIISDAVVEGKVAVIGVFYHLKEGKAELMFSSQDLTAKEWRTTHRTRRLRRFRWS